MRLTVDIQDNDFIIRRSEICVAGHTDKTGVKVLPAHIGEGEVIDGHPVWSMLERLVDDGVVEVPSYIWPGSSYMRIDNKLGPTYS